MADGPVYVIDRVVTRPGSCQRVRRHLPRRVRARRARPRHDASRRPGQPTDLVRRSIQHGDHHLVAAQRAGVVGDDVERSARSHTRAVVGRHRRTCARNARAAWPPRPTTSTGSAMYSVTRMLDVAEVERDRVLAAARAGAAATGARHQLVEPTLPGVRNGGDILVHLRFDTEDQWRSVETDFADDTDRPCDHPRQRCLLFRRRFS